MTGIQRNCSILFSEENRYLGMEQISKAVWTTGTVHLCFNFHLLTDFFNYSVVKVQSNLIQRFVHV